MPYILEEKINIGISACNFGTPVRYNMKGWNRVEKLDREKDSFFWTPLCPEIMSGMPTPREPIKLSGGNGHDFWAGKAKIKNKKGKDMTAQIKAGNIASMEMLHRSNCEAFIFQEGSPSCGIYRTTLKNQRLGKPPGTFGALLLNENFFLIPANDLESPVKWWDWRRRLHAFIWLKRKEISSKKEIFDIWHNFKFLCQEVDAPAAKKIGKDLANMENFSEKTVDKWREKVLRLLRKPSHYNRIKAVMEKHFSHYNKHFHGKTEKISLPADEISKTKFVKKLKEMEKRAFLEGYDFAGVPVIFRGNR